MSENNISQIHALRPWRMIVRKKTRKIKVGNIFIGGDAPIAVQSMTNIVTSDIKGTIAQIKRIEKAGADLVRVSCPDEDATQALAEIIKNINIPLVADIHFHYKRAIEAAKAGAACLRINPGNIGKIDRVKEVVAAAKDNDCALRIGVNAGSLEKNLLEKYGEPNPQAMLESALFHANILRDLDFHRFKISVKASDIFLTVAAYNLLSEAIDCPLHVGITEAGGLRSGTVKSSIGLGNLLWSGIGDTIRVSLSAEPEEEVKVGFDILKSLHLRHRGVTIISCPSCARQGFDVIKTVAKLEDRLSHISQNITLSIIGCVVNGPGEAKFTDIGFTGGGAGKGMLYISGKAVNKLNNDDMLDKIVDLVETKIQDNKSNYPQIIERNKSIT